MLVLYLIGIVGAGLGVYALAEHVGRVDAETARAARERATIDATAPIDSIDPAWPVTSIDPAPRDDEPIPGVATAPPSRIDYPAVPTIDRWAALLAPGCIRIGAQLAYVLRWIMMESGGNPCRVGYPAARGPDGNPREMGIAQFYNPDDLNRLGITGDELRAYCVPGDQHEVPFGGKIVRGFSNELVRPLLPAEMQRQADAAIRLIARCMSDATRDLVGVGAGASWSPSRRDYWTLVKLQHGLPALSRQGLPAVTAYLGRPPESWSEFRRTLDKVRLGSKVEDQYRGSFPRILDNAEKCAGAFAERDVA